jgi:hypothetical protein
MTSIPSIPEHFRAVNDWLISRGYRAGFPNRHAADWGDGVVCGTILLREDVADWRDVPHSELGNPSMTDLIQRFQRSHDYARRHGYAHGFPNFHNANYGQGIVHGTFLVRSGAVEWRDVPASDLGIAESSTVPTVHDWIWKTYNYATARGYAAGMPTFYRARYDRWVYGTILFPHGVAAWQDVFARELGFRQRGQAQFSLSHRLGEHHASGSEWLYDPLSSHTWPTSRAIITSVSGGINDWSGTVYHSDPQGYAREVPLFGGRQNTGLNGMPVEGNWRASMGGAVPIPSYVSLSVTINWEEQ